MTIHNEAKLGEIAKTVLMPGDPLRAKFIAETFLEDYKLVNSIRGMYAYTGYYKGKKLTVMASGMGMPSMGIYCYELYKFYEVENIIRIGSSGAYKEELNLLDIILVENSYNEGSFAKTLNNEECHFINSSKEINDIIENTAKELNQNYIKGNIATLECFDAYVTDPFAYEKRIPKEYNILAPEMESFALFYTAKVLNKKASCLVTVSDSNFRTEILTPEERQLSLEKMIKLALESAIKL